MRRAATRGKGDVGEVDSSSPFSSSFPSLAWCFAGDTRRPDSLSPNLRGGGAGAAATGSAHMMFCSMRWNVSMLLSASVTDDAISATLEATPGPSGRSIVAKLSLNRLVEIFPAYLFPAFMSFSVLSPSESTSCSLSLTSSPSAHILGDGPGPPRDVSGPPRDVSAAGAASRLSRTDTDDVSGSSGVSFARMTQLGDSSSSDSDSASDSEDCSTGGNSFVLGRFNSRFNSVVNSVSSGGGAGGVTDLGNPCITRLGVDPLDLVKGVNSSLCSRWNAARIHSGSAVTFPSPGENEVSLCLSSFPHFSTILALTTSSIAASTAPLDVPALALSTTRRRSLTHSSVGSSGGSSRSAGGASSPKMAPRSAAAFALSSCHGCVDLADDAKESSSSMPPSLFRRSSFALRTASRRSRMKFMRWRPAPSPSPLPRCPPDVVNGRRWLGGVAFFALMPPPLAAALDADAGDFEGRPLEPNAPAVPVPLRKILRLAFGADEGEGSVGVRIRAAARLR